MKQEEFMKEIGKNIREKGEKLRKYGFQQKREVCFKEKVVICIEFLRGLKG